MLSHVIRSVMKVGGLQEEIDLCGQAATPCSISETGRGVASSAPDSMGGVSTSLRILTPWVSSNGEYLTPTMARTSHESLNLLLGIYVAKYNLVNARSSALNKEASFALRGATPRAVLYNDPYLIA